MEFIVGIVIPIINLVLITGLSAVLYQTEKSRVQWKVAAKKAEAREEELRDLLNEATRRNVELTRELALKEEQKQRVEQVLQEYFNLKLEG